MLSGGQYPRGMPPPEPRPPGAPGLPGPGKSGREGPSSGTRLLVAGLAGLAAGAAVTLTVGWRYGLLAAWMFAAVVFLVQVWSHIARMDPPTTAAHAVREDSGRKTTHVLVVLAAVASLGAVALLLSSGSSSGKDLQALLSVGSVALAWASVHTMYTTRYARLYYTGEDGGIDFNEDEPPTYVDFAYLAFTKVDGGGHDDGAEQVRQQRMPQRGGPDGLGFQVGIGDLEGHPDGVHGVHAGPCESDRTHGKDLQALLSAKPTKLTTTAPRRAGPQRRPAAEAAVGTDPLNTSMHPHTWNGCTVRCGPHALSRTSSRTSLQQIPYLCERAEQPLRNAAARPRFHAFFSGISRSSCDGRRTRRKVA